MKVNISDYNSPNQPTWCSGCGNFAIHTALKKALSDMEIQPSQVVMTFDIGCNGNGADKINTYAFKGLHGRAIPLAIGAHLANREFVTIADIGDGGCFHEGLDHLVHAIRSNYDITILIHNNQNFALTTGQATLSTPREKPMYGLPGGRPENDLNISEFILNLKPSLYSRAYSGNPLQLSELIKKSVENKGCSIIEILQICPTYNKEFTPEWAANNIKEITSEMNHNEEDIEKGRSLIENKTTYTGIIFRNSNLESFYDSLPSRKGKDTELVDEVKEYDIKKLLQKYM